MNDPNPDISASLKGILALPLPELDGNDMGYKFDIFTGASLGLDALKVSLIIMALFCTANVSPNVRVLKSVKKLEIFCSELCVSEVEW